jgi:multidrug efflux system membrane fusion protein
MTRRAPALSAAAILLAGAVACSGDRKAPAAEAVPVRVGTVVKKAVPVQVRNVGTVQAYNTVAVRALVGGEILRVHFRDGQDVGKRDLLFTIDPRPYQAALAQAQAALARDKAQWALADTDVRRYEDLVQKDYVTRQQYDSVVANAAATAATVHADEAAVERARLELEYCSIRSPIDGRTGAVMVQVGNSVKPNDVALVMINQISPIYVSFAVPEPELPEIRRRQAAGNLPVDALEPGSGTALARGELTFFDNTVDRSTGTITLKATFANAAHRLWPGEYVDAVLTLAVQPDAVVAPVGAVQNGQQGPYVYVVKPDATVESRPVEVARSAPDGTIIAKGLSAGEKVVTDGQLRLSPGSKVEIVESSATAKRT